MGTGVPCRGRQSHNALLSCAISWLQKHHRFIHEHDGLLSKTLPSLRGGSKVRGRDLSSGGTHWTLDVCFDVGRVCFSSHILQSAGHAALHEQVGAATWVWVQ